MSIHEVARESGLSGPTLRYYEQVGLIGPVERDENSHRMYGADDVRVVQTLSCLRAVGMGIEDMRRYVANLERRGETAAEQRDLLLQHAERVEEEMAAKRVRLAYLRAKAAMWDARDRQDAAAETEATDEVRRAGLELRVIA
ncbi:MerR family transcriptional regulator [Spongisporangium articulatum]|uniref:MerR family transcriptional regulator n=1 Tax=Spongisporangium articulatum TaxID=3362603 RepID=A0ABW8ALX9_9ACTN